MATSQLPEAFHPANYPSLALQTYEFFGGDADRASNRQAFIEGSSHHLKMTYPVLVEDRILAAGVELAEKRQQAIHEYGTDSATVHSIQYRIEEVEFLRSAVDLNIATNRSDRLKAERAARRFVDYTERLYGAPDEARFADVWSHVYRLSRNNQDPRVQDLWHQLEHGFVVDLAEGTAVEIKPPQVVLTNEPQARLGDEAVEFLTKEWRLFAAPLAEAQMHVADMIAAEEGQSIDYDPLELTFSGKRLYDTFRIGAIGVAELLGIEPFSVERDETASAASWDTARHAIVVGQKRPTYLSSYASVCAVVPHETTHGVKAAYGAQQADPAMATGVFSLDSTGHWNSYLDFEEGNNKIGERLLRGPSDTPLARKEGFDVVAGLVYRGYDDRETYEIFKRLILAEVLTNNPEADYESTMAVTSRAAALHVERMFRGTPIGSPVLVDGHAPIYTKDLAYSRGGRHAIKFWNTVVAAALKTKKPQQYVHEVFTKQNRGKLDPSDPAQAVLVGL